MTPKPLQGELSVGITTLEETRQYLQIMVGTDRMSPEEARRLYKTYKEKTCVPSKEAPSTNKEAPNSSGKTPEQRSEPT